MTDIQMAYPLQWIAGRPRTPWRDRKCALWKEDGRRLTMTTARRRLREQVGMMTRVGQDYRITEAVLSTNIRYTASGGRDQNVSKRDPDDVGVVFYFALDGKAHSLACDRWDTVQDNIAAIAAHIEALRGQERWGVADLVQAFAGHAALPAPEQWWQVLGISQGATAEQINAAYRALAREAHPDRGGSDSAMARLNSARDRGLESLRRAGGN